MLFNVEQMFRYAHGKRQQEDQISLRHRGSNFESVRGREESRSFHAAKRANSILGMIKRTIVSRDQDVVYPTYAVYKSLIVRQHLEYCVQA